jgi:tryptophanyl-tRNA synthetase
MVNKRNRVLSGTQPTGRLHIGHLVGALRNYVALQEENDCFYSVVDWHALTSMYSDPGKLQAYVTEVVAGFLAAGVDPEKSVIFVQSDVKEHAELHLLLSMMTPLGWLERVPTYKEKKAQITDKDLSNYGFLGYPVLQTADIIIYKANLVPVGEDQLYHLELAREIVRRFHHITRTSIFPEPEAKLTVARRVPGLDGRKMSKSYGNSIYLEDTEEEITKKLSTMVTDTRRVRRTDPGEPDDCPVFALHKIFSTPTEQADCATGCRTAGIGCFDCKKVLIHHVLEEVLPVGERVKKLKEDGDYLNDVLNAGAIKAREVAAATMDEVRIAMNLKRR